MLEIKRYARKRIVSWLFDADRKICPSESLFGITQQSLVMPNTDPRKNFSIRTSHPWKILIFYIWPKHFSIIYSNTRDQMIRKVHSIITRPCLMHNYHVMFFLALNSLRKICIITDIAERKFQIFSETKKFVCKNFTLCLVVYSWRVCFLAKNICLLNILFEILELKEN